MPLGKILISIFILILFGAGTIIGIQSSLWYVFEGLPPGVVRIAIDQSQPGSETLISYMKTLEIPTANGLSYARRFAISISDTTTTIIAIPTNLWDSSQLIEAFMSDGWNVQRRGLLITATSGSPTNLSQQGVATRAVRRILSRNYPIKPLLLIAATSNIHPALNEAVTLVGTVTSRTKEEVEVRIDISTTPEQTKPVYTTQYVENEDEFEITLRGNALNMLPEQVLSLWTQALMQDFGLFGTTIDVPQLFTAQQNITLKRQGNVTVLVGTGNTSDFVEEIKQWVQDAESKARQETRAFRLPDNTVGFEFAPGETQPVFHDDPGVSCQMASWSTEDIESTAPDASIANQVTLWLCSFGDRAALGTDQAAALAAAREQRADQPKPPWSITATGIHAQALHQNIKSLVASGDDQSAVIIIKLRVSPF